MSKKAMNYLIVMIGLMVISFTGCCFLDYIDLGAKAFFILVTSGAAGMGAIAAAIGLAEELL